MPFNGFVNTFTNSPIQPSDVSYLTLPFNGASTTIVLEWPFQNPATLYPFSQFIKITGTGVATYVIKMPDAVYSSTVQSTIIYNTGTTAVTIQNADGTVIGTCAPTLAYYVGTTSNSTSAGDWVFLTLASGTANVIASNLIDATLNTGTPSCSLDEPNAGGLKAYSTHLKINQSIFPYTGTAYIGNQSDLGNIVSWTGGSGIYTLASASSVYNGFITGLQNRSTLGGVISLTPQGGDLINGSANTFAIQVDESTYLVSDGGSNWYTFAYSSNIAYIIQNVEYSLTSLPQTIVIPTANSSYQIQTFSGTYASGNLMVDVELPPTIVQQYFINNLSTTNAIYVYIQSEALDEYKYIVMPGNRLTTFTDGTHLYNSPNFLSNSVVYLPNGTVTAPSLTFDDANNTGLYRDTTTAGLAVTVLGVQIIEFDSTIITADKIIGIPDGTNAAPSLTFNDALSTGIYNDSSVSGLAISAVGVKVIDFTSSEITTTVPIEVAVGTNATPGYSFDGASGSGFFYTSGSVNLSIDEIPVMFATENSVDFVFNVDAASYTQSQISIYSLARAYG
jgi:hypothetical protein